MSVQVRILFRLLFAIVPVVLFVTGCSRFMEKSEDATYNMLRDLFNDPPASARPKVYWWCLNGNIDTVRAREELIAMKRAGIGGFDLFEIGSRSTMIPAGPAFLSDESLDNIKFIVDEAGRLGLTVGLNLASSWNAGGSWIEAKNGGKSLYRSTVNLKGNSSTQNITIPFPEINFPKSAIIGGTGKSLIPFGNDGRPEYYEEIAIMALPSEMKNSRLDTSMIVDLSALFDPDSDELIWEVPEGEWEISRFVCSNSGQQLVLPSPLSAGLTIDHFDSTAVGTHLRYVLNRLRPVMGDFRQTALKSLYLASYEARGFVWSSTLPDQFEEMHGYDIRKFLPHFFEKELFSQETGRKVESDFRKTLSEMMINNLYKKAREICNSYGLLINCEAGGPGYPFYNGPAEPLKALGALDLPRGEFWVNHARYYPAPNGIDSIDIMRVVKEVAAASHIYKRGIVEEEAFTSFQHWMEGPADLKPIGDRAFCEGMNRVVFHGFTHNPGGTGYPGIVYHAGTHMNDKRVWWPKINPFIDYFSRISAIFQNTSFTADVVFYYGDRIPNAVNPKNSYFRAGPGYDYEVINTEILLNDLSVKNGRLVLSNGAEFSLLAIDNEAIINPDVLSKLYEMAQDGAVIIGARPDRSANIINHSISVGEGEKMINSLWLNIDDPSQFKVREKGKIYSGITPREMLGLIGIVSDLDYRDKEDYLIDYIHFQNNGVDFYFIRNTSDGWISRECGFRQQMKVPELWDPATGEIIKVPVFHQDNQYLRIPVTMAPYGSYLVVFRKGDNTGHYSAISMSGEDPPFMDYTGEGICFLDEGIYELKDESGIRRIENTRSVKEIEGPWKLSFTPGWGAPDTAVFNHLIPLTEHEDNGIRFYSGITRYRTLFSFGEKEELQEEERIYLDLGDLSEVAEVWINGDSIGITWTPPHRFEITEYLRRGENLLSIETANNWCNRIIGDAITGEKYTATNIEVVGNLSWDKIALKASGLYGPVTIERVKLVK